MDRIHFSVYKWKPSWLLLAGIFAFALTHTAYSVDMIAWFSNVPFLLFLAVTKGWKARIQFVFALFVAWSVSVYKIITPPIPFGMIVLYSLPLTLFHLPAYLIWDRQKLNKASVLLFPAVFVIVEWLQYTYTPFASWGVMAYTQMHSIGTMQIVSVFGLAGLSFLIYWFNSSLARIILDRKLNLYTFYLPFSVLVLVNIFGYMRYELGKSVGNKTLTVAAVGTTSTISGLPLPSKHSNDSALMVLLQKTTQASEFGAKLIVWNEAAFYVLPEDEKQLSDSLARYAKYIGTTLIVSYIVPLENEQLKYENKLLGIMSTGELAYSYQKHQPVPGEPAIQGTEQFRTLQIGETNVGGAICYDYDFPYIARENSHIGADLVAVPSSDWRGIDPLHTRMAAFRAIEQGHSVLRSTRFGLSAAISPYGEMIGQMSSFDDNSRIMIAQLQAVGIFSVYSVIGDAFVYICIGFSVIFFTNYYISKSLSARLTNWYKAE